MDDFTSYGMHPSNWVNDSGETQPQDGQEFVDGTPQVNLVDSNEEDDSNMSPPKRKDKRKEPMPQNVPMKRVKRETAKRSPCWNHFDQKMVFEEDGVERLHAFCKHCKGELRADVNRNGTSALLKHIKKFPENPENKKEDKSQTKLNFKRDGNGEGQLTTWKHDDKYIKETILDFLVLCEQPFRLVEHKAFVRMINALNGRVNLQSRHTLSRDASKNFLVLKRKMKKLLNNPKTSVHLTTDTWTSRCQRINYMVVTAHFIDDMWNMHKRIINFRPINSHKGEDIGNILLDCIHGWGLTNIKTLTVDNASSNDKAVQFLIKKLPNLYEDENHFHIRCMAHILNLIMNNGLRVIDSHVECMTRTVRYIRNSTQRITKFKEAMKSYGLEKKPFLVGESPTRWNATFELLKKAVDLRGAFIQYSFEDYENDLGKVPEHSDFGALKEMVDFLEKFKTKTEIISTSTRSVAHMFIREVLDVESHLSKWESSPKYGNIIKEMHEKHNKYWGDFDKFNDYMYFAVILDPTMKTKLFLHAFNKHVNEMDPEKMKPTREKELESIAMLKAVESRMEKLFNAYVERFDSRGSSQKHKEKEVIEEEENDFLGSFLNTGGSANGEADNEFRTYLDEAQVKYMKDFHILGWWKLNSPRFPILSRMAKDILAIQVSTVASESAFSTCRRVVSDYRTKLKTGLVEALICTADWKTKEDIQLLDDDQDTLDDDPETLEIAEEMSKLDDEVFEY